MAVDIAKVLTEIKSRNQFPTIKRQQFNYSLEQARKVVIEIGRSRTQAFTLDNDNTFTYDNFVKWIMADPTMEALDPASKLPVKGNLSAGMYIAGSTGTGKSWLLEIMSAFCAVDEPRISFGDVNRTLRWLNLRADQICDEYASTGNISRYKTMPILGIQDLGSEPRESLYMGNRLNVIASIIESRGDRNDLLTLITSNIPLAHQRLKDMYGDRVVSRLYQMCNYFELRGRDRRKELR